MKNQTAILNSSQEINVSRLLHTDVDERKFISKSHESLVIIYIKLTYMDILTFFDFNIEMVRLLNFNFFSKIVSWANISCKNKCKNIKISMFRIG